MIRKPEVGLPTTTAGGCAYSVDLDSRSCGQPETLHLAIQSASWGLVALSTCGAHAYIARATGEVLGGHDYRPTCATSDCWAGVA